MRHSRVNSPHLPIDDNGHGTHIAGIIAANHNGSGISGIHPRAKLLPLKIFSSGGVGTQLNAALAVRYAVNQGADIINCSWGYSKTKLFEDAIAYAIENNVIVVAAVGNHGKEKVYYPAGFPGVLGAGSIDNTTNQLTSYSNLGHH